jgi:hypothetical protein
VVDVAATPARRTAEVASTAVMIERTRERFGLVPSRLAGDAAYGTGLLVGWLRRQGIEPHVPVLDGEKPKTKAQGLFGRTDFAFDPARDVYVCPAGHDMTTSGHVVPGGLRQYRAKATTCGPCALKARCTAGAARMVTRNIHEERPNELCEREREHVRQLTGIPEFRRSARERRKVEMLFAHLKRHLGFRHLRLRGLTGAGDEFLLATTAQNLRRLARSLPAPPSLSPPTPA